MRAAEKYADLEARGEDRPLCKCHGAPMRWKAAPSGGGWRCNEKHKLEYRLRYHDPSRDYRERVLSRCSHRYALNIGGRRDKVTEQGSRKIMVFGESITLPDQSAKEFALRLREDYKRKRG